MSNDRDEPLRIGVLGAARISELAIVKPAKLTGTRLVAVAARDRARAEAFAARHGVESVVDSYQEVLDHPDVEAVYNPLANSLHAPWNAAALRAGKHVLTEKPSAGNAQEAETIRQLAESTGVQFFEGFHYLYHPNIARLHEILASGEIGELRSVESILDMPAPEAADPRWSFDLAGGALMDLGCYALHSHRALAPLAGGEPVIVEVRGGERAKAPGVDEWMTATLRFPNGVVGTASCNMAAAEVSMSHRVVGSDGEALIPDFVNPHRDDRLLVTTSAGTRTERAGDRSSYTYQLEAFTTAVRTGRPAPTDAADAVRTMELVDQCYRAVGLPLRRSSALVGLAKPE